IYESKYKEETPLGEGNFGTVFAGYRIEDRLPVAIKHISQADIDRKTVTVRGETVDVPLEVLLLGLMASSRGMVQLLDWFDLDEEVIIILERPVPCINLLNFLENASGRLQEDLAKEIMKQLLDAAAETLSAGIFHRDIKLENILLHTDSDVPRVKLIDFGCGTLADEPATDLAGTPDYFSPEMFKDSSYAAGPTTVWQLGVVLYALLHGRLPFGTRRKTLYKTPKISKQLSAVPKTAHPREPNHFTPVALTSHLMKTMERLILNHLHPLVSSTLAALQFTFTYQPGIGVDDAIIYLLHRSLSLLEHVGSTVRVMVFDFSSAFNTIQPSLLRGKLEGVGVDCHLTAWTIDYLTNRP
ncbi:hypothetical protein LDENG_00154260, partial [Lucifuga dentata]